jgi:hypothetical protein
LTQYRFNRVLNSGDTIVGHGNDGNFLHGLSVYCVQ